MISGFVRLLSFRIWIPTSNMIRGENQKHRPALLDYKHGVLASLAQCISLTLKERLELLDLSSLNHESMKVSFRFTWGLDGSGDHADYHQLSKCEYSTKSVMSVCFSLSEVKVTDGEGKHVIWTSSTSGANKPQNTRPLALFPEKESSALLQDLMPRIESDVKLIKDEGIIVKGEDEFAVTAVCEEAKLSMADGKMITTLLNLGGAYCTMCSKSQKECQEEEVIMEGFAIDRSVESISQLALSLADPDTGEIIKKKGDYSDRTGICGQPITEEDVTKLIPVCHSKIRSFEWLIDLAIRALSHRKWYTVTNRVVYTKEDNALYKEKRQLVKEVMKSKLGINIGDPGDMITGAAFQKFSSDFAREILCNLLPEDEREDFSQILLGICSLVKVMNSQKRRVNVDNVSRLGRQVYLLIVRRFPWAAISPSVHRILAHSWEVIQLNDCYGLGNQSEEGLEALNKNIRSIRSKGASKTSTENNFTDVWNHLWDRSRPTIVDMERKIQKRQGKIIIATEIESIVESLFEEEGDCG